MWRRVHFWPHQPSSTSIRAGWSYDELWLKPPETGVKGRRKRGFHKAGGLRASFQTSDELFRKSRIRTPRYLSHSPHRVVFQRMAKRSASLSAGTTRHGYPPREIELLRMNLLGSMDSGRHVNEKFFDRIDIHCEVPLVDFRELSSNTTTGEKSETIRERVVQARRTQSERFRKSARTTNSAMTPRQVKQH